MSFQITIPSDGQPIEYQHNALHVPSRPIIPYIEGDGIGVDITPAMRAVIDAAVEKTYDGKRRLAWMEILAGEKAFTILGTWLPDETIEAIKRYRVAIKGPLTTPIGGGIRSLNVTMRQMMDLYACVRPVRWYTGIPSPVKRPEDLNVVIFRENIEDVYSGIEWPSNSEGANRIIALVEELSGKKIRPESGIGIKPMSPFGSKRLVRKAINYAIESGRKTVTLVHKGNIMKFTEGAFREWGYEAAREYGDKVVFESDLAEGTTAPSDKILINDRIADSTFQQLLLRPSEYSVLATPNLNGDYLSDACAAQVGGLGIAPGANIGDGFAVFEATHGTAPKYAGKDMSNPGSLILSAVMMLDFLGWKAAATLVETAFEKAIAQKTVTYDFARQMEGATKVGCSEFAQAIIRNM